MLPVARMALPPCVLNPEKNQSSQTYVMKLEGDTSSVQPWLIGQLTIGAGAWAQVSIQSPALEPPARYVVLMEKPERRLKQRQRAI